MLRLLFQRYSTLVSGKSFADASSVVPNAPKEVVMAFSSKLELHDYLKLDDSSISQFCKACEESKDQPLQRLGSGLLNRRYLKAIDATDCRPEAVLQFGQQVADVMKRKGYDADFSSNQDTPADTPYKMYDPDAEAPNTQIYVENNDGKQTEISKLSQPVAQLRNKYALSRFYFPPDVRDDIEKIAKNTLRN
jgi:HD superfamily phosphohydrolase